jgi:hypothetical protein
MSDHSYNPNPRYIQTIRIGDTVQLVADQMNSTRNTHYVVVDIETTLVSDYNDPNNPVFNQISITIVRKHPPQFYADPSHNGPIAVKRIFWVNDGDDATELGDYTIMGRKVYGTDTDGGRRGHSTLGIAKIGSYTMDPADRLPWEIDSYGISLGFMKDGHSLLCEDCARQAYVEKWGCVEAVDVTTVHKQECDESCGSWIGEAVYYDELGLGHLVEDEDQLEDGETIAQGLEKLVAMMRYR